MTAHITGDSGIALRAVEAPETFKPLQLNIDDALLEATIEHFDLHRVDVRQPVWPYLKAMWRRRDFVWTLARWRLYSKNRHYYLGQLWNVLTPLFQAAVFILLFGLLLRTYRGVENSVAFVITGTISFRFFTASIAAGSGSIRGNGGLIQQMRFPRAVLPVAHVLTELMALVPGLVVMCVMVWLSRCLPGVAPVPITWRVLLLPLALLPYVLFSLGLAFIFARVVDAVPDMDNFISVFRRLFMFASGVIYSIPHRVEGKPAWVQHLLMDQPVAVYLETIRSCLLNEPTIPLSLARWVLAYLWAVPICVIGFLLFWRGEPRYGTR